MRPRSEAATELLLLACKLSAAGRGVTVAELVAGGFGRGMLRTMVPALKRRGQLRITGTRRVSYRNRPVAVYEPVLAVDPVAGAPELLGAAVLCNCMATWARQA